jgi:hypothetical protein
MIRDETLLMLKNALAYIWLLTLATVLPLQAYAHLMQSDNAIYNHPNIISDLADKELEYSRVAEGRGKQTDPTPTSQVNTARELVAFLNTPRWFSPKIHIDEAEPSGNSPSRHELDPTARYQIHLQPTTNAIVGKPLRYVSIYRISGWKESNALYVALNAHFLAIS